MKQGPTRAILDLLEVQTSLEVNSQQGRHIPPHQAAKMAEKIDAAKDLLQATLLAAARILEEGPSE